MFGNQSSRMGYGSSMFFVLLMLVKANIVHSLYHNHNQWSDDAIKFINSFQNPSNCTGKEYIVSDIGIGGGFAAQFQLAGSEWMRTIYATNFSIPVLIKGRLHGYSDGSKCKHVNHDWTCFFLPMSNCQDELLRTGREIRQPAINRIALASTVPPQFMRYGYVFWWGVVQIKMFRFQPVVEQYVIKESHSKAFHEGFPFGSPVVGMHVRHGDKFVDGFAAHSMEEELNAVSKSPECYKRNFHGDCFYRLDFTESVTIDRTLKRHAMVMNISDIEHFSLANYSFYRECKRNGTLACHIKFYDSKQLLPFVENPHHHSLKRHHAQHSHHHQHVSVTDQHRDLLSTIRYLSTADAFTKNTISAGNNYSSSGEERHELTLVTPLRVFLASDDLKVLTAGQSLGFMADTSGVSQSTAQQGMLKTLTNRPEMGFDATLEVVSDIYFLSQCSTLLGIAASQVYRIAVGISNATGTLRYAVAMDSEAELHKVRQLSTKYYVPFPEVFAKP